MKWKVAAPYFESHADRWITDSIASQRHSFELVCRPTKQRNWHQSSSNRDGLRDWVTTIRHANQAFSQRDNGVITVYPQLAAAAGMAKMIQRSDRPLVAWLFNTENIRTFCRRTVARKTLSKVDAFVVHTTRESASYSSLLKIPEQRFIFVPQQYGARVETEKPARPTSRTSLLLGLPTATTKRCSLPLTNSATARLCSLAIDRSPVWKYPIA